jgi:hypothetical protein
VQKESLCEGRRKSREPSDRTIERTVFVHNARRHRADARIVFQNFCEPSHGRGFNRRVRIQEENIRRCRRAPSCIASGRETEIRFQCDRRDREVGKYFDAFVRRCVVDDNDMYLAVFEQWANT